MPEPVKRKVRQDAGFGCCKCGQPIIQYHHIVPKSKNPEDIMPLCPFPCHYQATQKVMSKEEQLFYKSNPYNIRNGYVKGQLEVKQKIPVVNVGNNQLIGTGDLLQVDGEHLLSVEINEGIVEMSIKLYDRKDNLVAEIRRNEWISGNPLPWDIEAKFQLLKIRHKSRKIAIELDARNQPMNLKADMWRHKSCFKITPDAFRIFRGCLTTAVAFKSLAFVGLEFVVDTSQGTITFGPQSQYGKGELISNPNTKERIRLGLLKWNEISCKHEFVTIIDNKKYTVMKCDKCGTINKEWK